MASVRSPIAIKSRQCLRDLDRISKLSDDGRLAGKNGLIGMQFDEDGRFRIWANNIGALLTADYRNSLDFRLQNTPKISIRITEFLDDLQEALDDVSAILTGKKPNRVSQITDVIKQSEMNELSETLDIVKNTITSLMRASMIIRDATPRDRYLKANESNRTPFINSYDIAHVGHKFPKLDVEGRVWLKERLGKAITQRRQYLRYSREHHSKFQLPDEAGPLSIDKTPIDVFPSEDKSQIQTGTVRSLPVSAFAPTDASTLQASMLRPVVNTPQDTLEDISDAISHTSYATSVHDDTNESRLKPPNLTDIAQNFPFECPYCWSLQELRDERSWRKHFFSDLRPYVCTFQDCDVKLFADRHLWFDHELECHRVEWHCRFCNHPPFMNESLLKAHMRARHPKFSSDAQLPSLVMASRQSMDRIPATDCLLCDWDARLRDSNTDAANDDILVVTPEQFRRHLGSHMEQLALFALPRSYKDEDEDAESNEAAARVHSHTSSRGSLEADALSWKSNSNRDINHDQTIPDLPTDESAKDNPDGPRAEPQKSDPLYPWSRTPLTTQSKSLPFPRYGCHVNQVCSKEGDLYAQGGLIDGHTVMGDLWMIETTGHQLGPICHMIPTTNPNSRNPGPRVGGAAQLVGNAFIIFGGDTKVEDTDLLDNTLYLLNTGTRQWSKWSNNNPFGRYGHTMSLVGSHIVIFGGQIEGAFFNDLDAFDLNGLQQSTTQWKDWNPPTNRFLPRPEARTNHTMTTWKDRLYLFGGTNGKLWFNDVWEHDTAHLAWTKLACVGYVPCPREGHAATQVGDVMYVFGGRTEEGADLGDLAAFRIPSRRWYTFQNMGPTPSPRSGHSMSSHGKIIWVVGGEPSTSYRDVEELRMAYALDTGKIRYPNDDQILAEDDNIPPSPDPPKDSGEPSAEIPYPRRARRSSSPGVHDQRRRARTATLDLPGTINLLG